MSSRADLSASDQRLNAMQSVPVTKASILPLVGAVPRAAVALTTAPLQQVLGELKGPLPI